MNVNDQAFTDVTLAILDNQHVRAHKIILSSLKHFVQKYFGEVYKRILMQVSHQNIFRMI